MSSEILHNETPTDQLIQLLEAGFPSHDEIKRLVSEGANLNHLFGGDSLLMKYAGEAIGSDYISGNIPLATIQLLIDLGADPNFTSGTGMNLLQDAVMLENVELIKLLLKAGTNPNCIDFQISNSLLDWAEYDLDFEESQGNDCARLRTCVNILKDFGAKGLDDLYAREVEEQLVINENHLTGLITKKGNIHIEQIIGITPKLISDFHAWLSTSQHRFVDWDARKGDKDRDKLRLHNEQGVDCVLRIKALLGDKTNVAYYSHNIDNFQIAPFYFDILVMSDFEAVFWSEGTCIGSAGENPGNHPISSQLKSEFLDWHTEFEKQGGENHHLIDWNKYNARGRELTAKLQAELCSHVNVRYEEPFESKKKQ